jgi:hypothetical protein
MSDDMKVAENALLYFPKTTFSKRFGSQFFTMDITDYQVVNVSSCWDKHAEYVIQLKQGKSEWTIKRRFREFEKFLASIRSSHHDLPSDKIPALPPKTCFRVLDDEDFLIERKMQLYDFLDNFLRELSQKNLLKDQKVIEFLEIDPNLKGE